MTNNCNFYGVGCDQCTPDLTCRDYLPGVAGFCYRYSESIASIVQNLLPIAAGAYGLSLIAKKVLPTKDSTESLREYAKKIGSSVCSTVGSYVIKAKEALAPRTDENRCQQIARVASQSLQSIKNNPGKVVAAAASLLVPQLVPALLQMPALTALALGSIATIKNGNEWFANLKDLVTQRPDEPDEAFKKRMQSNGMKAIASIGLLAGVGAAAGILIPEIIQKSTTYNVWLPFQTPATAFIEYNPLVLAHGLLALRDGTNGKKISALYHTLSSLSTLAFPLYIVGTHQPLRLHHFWIGQFFQALPSLSAKLFGLFLSIDGWVQITTPTGYLNYDWGNWDYSSYGCDNVTMDHFDSILFAGSLALLLDGVSKILFSHNRPEDLSIWQSAKSLAQRVCCCRRTTDEFTRLLDASSERDYMGATDSEIDV